MPRRQNGGVEYTFESELWRWTARRELWVFASLPPAMSDDIDAIPRPPHGFASIPVRATIGATSWTTSIFPDNDRGSYSLPIRKAVRTAEGLELGQTVTVTVELVGLEGR